MTEFVFNTTALVEIALGGLTIYYIFLIGWAYKKTRKNMERENQ